MAATAFVQFLSCTPLLTLLDAPRGQVGFADASLQTLSSSKCRRLQQILQEFVWSRRLRLVSPLSLVMFSAAGRHLQQTATNTPVAAPAAPSPPITWGDRWDGGASLNYGSRVGELTHELHVLQSKCITSISCSQ